MTRREFILAAAAAMAGLGAAPKTPPAMVMIRERWWNAELGCEYFRERWVPREEVLRLIELFEHLKKKYRAIDRAAEAEIVARMLAKKALKRRALEG